MIDPIIIVPYDITWPARFQELAQPLRAALGPLALRIDHIGSTAVPGLDAKPVIDIQISVATFTPFEPVLQPLQALGWRWFENNPHLSKRYFREPARQPRTHLHVRLAGSWSEQFQLLFRDYLRAEAEDRLLYARTKRTLASQYREDREAYTEAKSDVIWQIMQRANEWSQFTGWQPGPSDA